jgi:uncharacterized membrane protein
MIPIIDYNPSSFYMGSLFLFIAVMLFLAAVILVRYFKDRREAV